MISKIINTIINEEGTDRNGATRDLLTDLLHYCEQHGIDFDNRLAAARRVYLEEQTWVVRSMIKPNHYWAADKCDWVRGMENATVWTGEMMQNIDSPPFGEWERQD